MLQFSFKQDQIIEFGISDPAVERTLQDVHSRIPDAGPAPKGSHALIASLLRHSVDLVGDKGRAAPKVRDALAPHVAYHRGLIARYSSTQLENAAEGFEVRVPREDSANGVRQCVGELIGHLATGFNLPVELIRAPGPSVQDRANPLFNLVPRAVFDLRTEADLNVIAPWFMRSLDVPGDICEFGCYQGTMSIKFAYALKTLGIDKTVYAFDTFEGFLSSDPTGGPVGVGYYDQNYGAFGQLTLWSKSIPVRPIKGDATETCKVLNKPLSFVWLDLDIGALMRPVFEVIWPLLTKRSIVGVDDVGRVDGAGKPITPGVEPWVDELVASRRLTELERHPGAFVRIYRVNK